HRQPPTHFPHRVKISRVILLGLNVFDLAHCRCSLAK
ncbi:MAG: hypothetical protein ACJAV4_000587, partial [Pontimonas sp.]